MMRNLLLLDTLCALSLSKSCHISNFDAAGEESTSRAAVLERIRKVVDNC
jgi:hypothetical protein